MAMLYEKKGKVAVITLNRPDALNSMDPTSLAELGKILTEFRDDDALWVAIITGAGERAFCAGADVKTMLPFMKDECLDRPWHMPATIMRGLELWKPVIAAINGVALGGGMELALSCDIRIASEKASFGVPEVKLGLIPGWGGTQRLPRVIPWAKAAEMLLTGQNINAQEAYRIGLVNQVVPPDQVMPTAMKWAELLCVPAPLAVRAAKEAMYKGSSLSLDEGLELEWALERYIFGTEDFTEGTEAFKGKRTPQFKAK
jgi:E-phenylitaconyl-CoA hydratase